MHIRVGDIADGELRWLTGIDHPVARALDRSPGAISLIATGDGRTPTSLRHNRRTMLDN
jgi:hypothetical protein